MPPRRVRRKPQGFGANQRVRQRMAPQPDRNFPRPERPGNRMNPMAQRRVQRGGAGIVPGQPTRPRPPGFPERPMPGRPGGGIDAPNQQRGDLSDFQTKSLKNWLAVNGYGNPQQMLGGAQLSDLGPGGRQVNVSGREGQNFQTAMRSAWNDPAFQQYYRGLAQVGGQAQPMNMSPYGQTAMPAGPAGGGPQSGKYVIPGTNQVVDGSQAPQAPVAPVQPIAQPQVAPSLSPMVPQQPAQMQQAAPVAPIFGGGAGEAQFPPGTLIPPQPAQQANTLPPWANPPSGVPQAQSQPSWMEQARQQRGQGTMPRNIDYFPKRGERWEEANPQAVQNRKAQFQQAQKVARQAPPINPPPQGIPPVNDQNPGADANSLYLNPQYEAGVRALDDELSATLAQIGVSRAEAQAMTQLIKERLGIEQREDLSATDEAANARGLFDSGIRTTNRNRVERGYRQNREDIDLDLARTFRDLASGEIGARSSYSKGLAELLTGVANSMAEENNSPIGMPTGPRPVRKPAKKAPPKKKPPKKRVRRRRKRR